MSGFDDGQIVGRMDEKIRQLRMGKELEDAQDLSSYFSANWSPVDTTFYEDRGRTYLSGSIQVSTAHNTFTTSLMPAGLPAGYGPATHQKLWLPADVENDATYATAEDRIVGGIVEVISPTGRFAELNCVRASGATTPSVPLSLTLTLDSLSWRNTSA